MATSYNNNLRVAIQETGDNQNTWGTVLSEEGLEMLIEAISGYVAVSVASGNVTLTTNNGATDQARPMMIKATGSPGTTRILTAPAVSKVYILWNASDSSVQIKTSGGTAVTVAAGAREWVFCDGTDFYTLTVNGDRWSGTDLAVTDGGTGSSTAAGARNNLGASGIVMLSSPASITFGSDDVWTTISNSDLATAGAKIAIIRAFCQIAPTGSSFASQSIYARKTGSGAGKTIATRICYAGGEDASGQGITTDTNDAYVELDSSQDFDILTVQSGTGTALDEAYIIGYII